MHCNVSAIFLRENTRKYFCFSLENPAIWSSSVLESHVKQCCNVCVNPVLHEYGCYYVLSEMWDEIFNAKSNKISWIFQGLVFVIFIEIFHYCLQVSYMSAPYLCFNYDIERPWNFQWKLLQKIISKFYASTISWNFTSLRTAHKYIYNTHNSRAQRREE